VNLFSTSRDIFYFLEEAKYNWTLALMLIMEILRVVSEKYQGIIHDCCAKLHLRVNIKTHEFKVNQLIESQVFNKEIKLLWFCDNCVITAQQLISTFECWVEIQLKQTKFIFHY